MRFTLPQQKQSLFSHSLVQGFTIIELLVVFTIAVILSGSGYVALTSYSRRQALDQIADDAKGAINQAKYSAVSKTKPTACGGNILTEYKFIICSAQNPCTTSNVTYETDAICAPLAPAIYSKKIPSSILIDQTNTTCKTLSYNTLTGFDGTGCKIVFTGYGLTKSVIIDNSGNSSIQ